MLIMMKSEKLSLGTLKVQSFVTELTGSRVKTAKGGFDGPSDAPPFCDSFPVTACGYTDDCTTGGGDDTGGGDTGGTGGSGSGSGGGGTTGITIPV